MIGILALQGAFEEHEKMLRALGCQTVLIRKKSDIPPCLTGLVLVGGESTTQRKLLHELDMLDILKERIESGVPVLATCAGLILLAKEISGGEQTCFDFLPVRVCRNAYGRQLGSFSAVGDIGSIKNFPMRFIRAPYIECTLADDEDTEVLNITGGRITAVRYKNILAMSFHPELTEDTRIHNLFVDMTKNIR